VSLVLVVNPGAGSTKLGLYRGAEKLAEESLRHRDEDQRPGGRIMNELPMRLTAVRAFVARLLPQGEKLAAAVGRGGLLAPVRSGTYLVNDRMIGDLEKAERGEHASNLGPPLARAIAQEQGCPAYIVDPVSVDELEPVARISGLEGIERRSFSHALNMKAVARRHAKQVGRRLEELRLVVTHLGTGVSLSAQRDGRMVDVVNPQDEGPFSGDRCGGLPATALIDLCFAAGAAKPAVKRRLFGDGGLYSYLGTRDAREAIAQAEAGDAKARLIVEAMVYRIAQSVGAMATVLEGRVDAILLTGGMAHNAAVIEGVRKRIAWIAPVMVYPGEDELGALAEGALRVLGGEERALCYPEGA
jgi:butyrate kinase